MDDKGNKPYTIDKDTELSPSIPLVEFHGRDNKTGIADCEVENGNLHLKYRLGGIRRELVIYCTIPDAPETRSSPWYGPYSTYDPY